MAAARELFSSYFPGAAPAAGASDALALATVPASGARGGNGPGVLLTLVFLAGAVGRCSLTPGTPWFSQLTPRLLSGTFRDFQRLKLKHDELLSNFACFGFNCNLCHTPRSPLTPCCRMRRTTTTRHAHPATPPHLSPFPHLSPRPYHALPCPPKPKQEDKCATYTV